MRKKIRKANMNCQLLKCFHIRAHRFMNKNSIHRVTRLLDEWPMVAQPLCSSRNVYTCIVRTREPISPALCLPASYFPKAKIHTNWRSSQAAGDKSSPKYDDRVDLSFRTRLAIVTGIVGILGGFLLFLQREKELEKQKKRKEALQSIGGSFELVDHHGNLRNHKDFLGQWLMLYFGFTHCPDICPEVLEKLVESIKVLDKDPSVPDIQPIFISVDPDRDTVKIVKQYVEEFSPRILGLTGPKQKIQDACKAYRVYVGMGPKDQFEDYIVDHTVILYLINPDGEFVDYYGLTHTADKIVQSVKFNVEKYQELQKKLKSWWPF